MLQNMKFKSDTGSGSRAAAYLIFSVGLVGATLFTGMAFWQHPEVPVLVLAIGGSLALLTLTLRLRPELPSAFLSVLARGQRGEALDYSPHIVRPPTTTFGTNRPPTVDEIRELKDTPRNWVPSRSRNGRSSLREQSPDREQ